MHSNKIVLVLVFLLSAFIPGCSSPGTPSNLEREQPPSGNSSSTVEPTQTPPGVILNEQALKNAKYELPDIGPFQLKDGQYVNQYGSGATQANRVDLQMATLGDLNGDGTPDAAVTLALNSGGSGTFIYLAALVNEGGAPKQAAAELLGDRVVVEGLSIENGQIVLRLKGFASGDPQCCPSQGATWTYKLDGNKLTSVSQVKDTPPALPTPTQVASVQSRYDPQKYQCSNPPILVFGDHVWQAYAAPVNGKGGDPVKAGQAVTLNLRSKLGPATGRFQVTVMVIAPDGSMTTAQVPLKGNDWAAVSYPQDFSGAGPTMSGVYTVLWRVPAGFLSCGGFQVAGS